MTVILPPPEIRLLIEKLAAYVVKNGRSFEDKILEKERHNPRFSFLFANDPYHPYYQKRLEEYKEVGPDYVDVLLARTREQEQQLQSSDFKGTSASNEHGAAKTASAMSSIEAPEPLEFALFVPPLSVLDFDVIKLTAQYVARNGRQFLINLSQREMRNPQFDFLKPTNSLHNIFLKLVDQYSKVLLPSKALLNKLDIYASQKFEVIDRITKRVQHTRYTRERQMQEDERAERDRLAYASIDWNDFTVVEAIDFNSTDKDPGNINLPKPMEFTTIKKLSLVQRRNLWSGIDLEATSSALKSTLMNDEAEMEIDDDYATVAVESGAAKRSHISVSAESPAAKQSHISVSAESPAAKQSHIAGGNNNNNHHHLVQPTVTATTIDGLLIRHDYTPRTIKSSHFTAATSGEFYETCPICNQAIPRDQIAEHMRIEALDPKWKEQRDRHLAKHQETNYLVSGVDVSRNLQALNRAKSEIASMQGDEEVSKALHQANMISASQTVIWDGRTNLGSISQATKEAMQKAKPLIPPSTDQQDQETNPPPPPSQFNKK